VRSKLSINSQTEASPSYYKNGPYFNFDREDVEMKRLTLSIVVCTTVLLVMCAAAAAQTSDKAKLIAIEDAFAANSDPGAAAAAVAKKYIYDGPVTQLTAMGRIGTLRKSRVVELSSAPDPADPNVRSSSKLSDFDVEIYGATALVAYKQVSTDSGHKDAALNVTSRFGCLDTFVKTNGSWRWIGGACASDVPIPESVWNADKRSIAQEPQDVQQAYH